MQFIKIIKNHHPEDYLTINLMLKKYYISYQPVKIKRKNTTYRFILGHNWIQINKKFNGRIGYLIYKIEYAYDYDKIKGTFADLNKEYYEIFYHPKRMNMWDWTMDE
jgi:hypothetical protein